MIDTTLSWTKHVDELMDKLSKLSKAYYAIRAVKSFITQEAMMMVYFSYYYVLKYNFLGELIEEQKHFQASNKDKYDHDKFK